MADLKISELTNLTAADPANDMIPIVDVSATPPASGSTKRISINNILACSPSATLASATISGDLTVATNRFAVSASGVGIGTTTMTYNLNVTGAAPTVTGIKLINTSGTSSNLCMFSASSAYASFGVPNNAGWLAVEGSNPLAIGPTGNGGIIFVNNGSEAMRLNSSGLGIGVTPSAWGAGRKAIQIASPANIVSANLTFEVGSNWWNDGTNYKYTATNPVSLYSASNGLHAWYTATSGNANDPISFGAAKMTLDASGRLLVGKTSGVNSIETVGAGIDGRATVGGVSTVATTIYTIKQSATAAMCVVFGDDGSNGFCDIVLFLATVAPKVVSSQTLYGSPAARTYSTSTTNLQLALASGTLSIRTAALSTLNT